MNRRQLLRVLGLGAGSMIGLPLLQACAPAAPEAPKPAAPVAASTPAPTSAAPVAAAQTAIAKPAGSPAASASPAAGASPVAGASPAASPVAAAQPSSAAPAQNFSGSLNVLTFIDGIGGSDSRGLALKQINENFLKKYPNVTVNFDVIPFEQMGPKFLAGIAAGNAPDVSWVRDDFYLKIRDAGGLEDLNQWISKWPAGELDDFYNEVGRRRGVEGDKRYLMYTFASVSGLHYRKDVFEKAGIDMSKPMTWDAWSQALQKVTVDSSGKHPTDAGFDVNNVTMWGTSMARLKTKNDFDSGFEASLLPLGKVELNPDTTANWANPEGVKAMTMWTDLVSKYKVQPQDDITRDGDACNLLFTSGQAATIWLAGQGYKDIVTKSSWDAKSQFKFTTWPSFDGVKPSPINAGAWTMGVSSKAKNKDLAWAWLEHYLSAESDAIMARVGGVLPSRLSTLKDPIFSTPDFQFLHDYLDVAAQGTFDPSRSRAKVTPATELANAFQDVIANGTSVEDALKASADRYNRAEMA